MRSRKVLLMTFLRLIGLEQESGALFKVRKRKREAE